MATVNVEATESAIGSAAGSAGASVSAGAGGFDVATLRKDFPLLSRRVNGHPITYLDSAASAQRPTAVLDAMRSYDETTHANVHRGVYSIAEEATRLFEAARTNVGRFIGAPVPSREVVFTKNATEALNLVAHTWGRTNLHAGDVIVLTEMEHHANIVPWHMLAEERGLTIRWVPVDDDGQLELDHLDDLLDGAKLLGVTCMSNVLGTLNPMGRLVEAAHRAGAVVVADGAQSVPHLPTDVAELGVDFIAFSSHKMLGPTGIGVLWGREELLSALPPFLGGGEMILDVRKDGFIPNDIPWRFEAGTPPITEAIGLGAAVDYLRTVGMDAVRAHELTLTRYAMDTLTERFGEDISIFGPRDPAARGGVLSFAYRDVHPHDVSQILDQYGVCVRAGHHCAKPLMRRLGVNATARASFGLYNDESDVDTLADALAEAGAFFG
jgi:cysteine desulfurase/selenocysteine lyase